MQQIAAAVKKNGNQCSAGCQCINCISIVSTKNSTLNSKELQDLALEEEHQDMPVEDMDDIMVSVFGTQPGT